MKTQSTGRPLVPALTLALSALSLMGCGDDSTMPVVVKLPVPAEANEAACPPEPKIPDVFVDERDAAIWTSRALEAGDACRIAWGALRRILIERSK